MSSNLGMPALSSEDLLSTATVKVSLPMLLRYLRRHTLIIHINAIYKALLPLSQQLRMRKYDVLKTLEDERRVHEESCPSSSRICHGASYVVYSSLLIPCLALPPQLILSWRSRARFTAFIRLSVRLPVRLSVRLSVILSSLRLPIQYATSVLLVWLLPVAGIFTSSKIIVLAPLPPLQILPIQNPALEVGGGWGDVSVVERVLDRVVERVVVGKMGVLGIVGG